MIRWWLCWSIAFGFALGLLTGCGGGADDLRKAVKSGAELTVALEPYILAAYKTEQEQCLKQDEPRQCVDAVRAKWDPLIDKWDQARKAWCTVDAAIGKDVCK